MKLDVREFTVDWTVTRAAVFRLMPHGARACRLEALRQIVAVELLLPILTLLVYALRASCTPTSVMLDEPVAGMLMPMGM